MLSRPDGRLPFSAQPNKAFPLKDVSSNQEAKPASQPAKIDTPASQEYAHFQSLAEMSGKNTIDLASAELTPLPLEKDEIGRREGSRCIEVKAKGKHLGYARTWFPGQIMQRVKEGDELQSLYEVFPLPIANVYYDIIDDNRNTLGKQSTFYSESAGAYLYSFVWNNGGEELYKIKNNAYYLVNDQGVEMGSEPVWTIRVFNADDTSRSRHEEIRLVKDPGVRLIIGSHYDGDVFNYRLQDSCSEDAKMGQKFLQIDHDGFKQFVLDNSVL